MQFESPKAETNEEQERAMTRRRFLKIIGAAGLAALCPDVLKKIEAAETIPSRYEKGWSYTLEQMKSIYEKEYNKDEKILENILRKQGDKWLATVEGKNLEVPQEFLDKTLALLKEMLERNLVKYLFRLDCFHGHFFVSKKIFKPNYFPLDMFEQARRLVRDENLCVLFHNNEHLDPKSSPEAMKVHQNRNVIGYYDGSDMKILPLPTETKRSAVSEPGHPLNIMLRIAAHKDGELSLKANGKEVRLDISLDDDSYY
jgi:hypothetical protein